MFEGRATPASRRNGSIFFFVPSTGMLRAAQRATKDWCAAIVCDMGRRPALEFGYGRGQKRAAEPSPKGGFHCCLQPHFSGRKETRVRTFPKDGVEPGCLSQPLRILCQKNAPLNLSREWYQQRYAIDNPLDLLEFSKYEMTR